MNSKLLFTTTLALTLSLTAFAQDDLAQKGKNQKPKPEAAKEEKKPGELKKYEDVITKDAKTQNGLFKVHQVAEKFYWEIPVSMLNRELLWQTEIAQMPSQAGYPGMSAGTKIIKFTRRENKLYMHEVNHDIRALGDDGTKAGVEANSVDPILQAFDIQAESKDKSPVVEVTQMFSSDSTPVTASSAMGAGPAEPNKSYIDKMKAFPENIETRSMLTFGAAPRNSQFFFLGGGGGGPATALAHYSLDLLPEKPMMGRLKDSRIGYFTVGFTEYGRPDNRAIEKEYITRFRLEKKDPTAEVSEPVKPIVFYLAREVPNKWRPYLKQGIEDWQPVFEKAGFKNAIICKDAPSLKEDADWDPEDARYSVIRWAPSETENAMGPSIQDPRSGETISAHVIVWNDIVKLIEDWYFSQTAAADRSTISFPMADDKIGNNLRYIVGHEVGHTLGLEHNFKASVAYTIKQLRDPEFMKTHGTSASIMSYSRYDYVAQPEDGVKDFANRLGPYDYFAIEYGYKPIPNTFSPEEEKPVLDKLLAHQVDDVTVRFGNYKYFGIDPGMQNENISNDPIEAAKLGLANIDRIAEASLMPATFKFGEDYRMLSEMDENLLGQRFTELYHIVALVGGVVETDSHAGRGAEQFTPVPTARQAAAVEFLMSDGMQVSPALTDPRFLRRISPTGYVGMVTNIQNMVIRSLLSDRRVSRLMDNEALNGARAYTVSQLVEDVSNGVWSELDSPMPKVDVYRRSLQRGYLKIMDGKINSASASQTDLKSLERDNLVRIAHRIDAAAAHAKDRVTVAHLVDCRKDIEKILNGNYSKAAAFNPNDFFFMGAKSSMPFNPKSCWAPYATLRRAAQELMDEEKKN